MSVKRKSGTASLKRTAHGATKRVVLHVPLGCGSLSITTPVSLLGDGFDVRWERSGSVVECLTRETEGPRVRASSASLRFVLEQDTFILALYWFNPGRPVLT